MSPLCKRTRGTPGFAWLLPLWLGVGALVGHRARGRAAPRRRVRRGHGRGDRRRADVGLRRRHPRRRGVDRRCSRWWSAPRCSLLLFVETRRAGAPCSSTRSTPRCSAACSWPTCTRPRPATCSAPPSCSRGTSASWRRRSSPSGTRARAPRGTCGSPPRCGRRPRCRSAFPPVELELDRLGVRLARPWRPQGDADGARCRELVLTDGGVYDNMADEWEYGYPERAAGQRAAPVADGAANFLVVGQRRQGHRLGARSGAPGSWRVSCGR